MATVQNAKRHLIQTEPVRFAKRCQDYSLSANETPANGTLKNPAKEPMRKGKEIPLKQWRYELAKRLGISESALSGRLYYPKRNLKIRIPYPKVRRVNKRVVFVQIET